jgi:hypothetical protein
MIAQKNLFDEEELFLEEELTVVPFTSNKSDNFFYNKNDIPLDISDIISICKEYSKLGWKIQYQVELITELGVQEAIDSKVVSLQSLPYIKNFLEQITKNVYFGDSTYQAQECINLITQYEAGNRVVLSALN